MKRLRWVMIIIIVIVLVVYIVRIGGRSHVAQEREVVAIMNEDPIQVPAAKVYSKYAVELSFDPDGRSFKGIVNIAYTHQYHRTTDEIVIHSRGIDIKDIQINSAMVPFEQKGPITLIESPFEIKKDSEMTLTVQFGGTLMRNENNPIEVASGSNFLPVISEYNEIYGWSKVSDEKADNLKMQEPGDYEVTIHTYKGQYPIATGTKNGVSEKDNIIATSFSANRVRDFGIFIGPFMEREVFNTQAGYSVVLYYIPSPGLKDETLATIKKSLRDYCNILGEYPYDQLTVVHRSGMGEGAAYPTMILGDFKRDQSTYAEINKLVGKQWLYYIIGKGKEEQWISEGLLEYLNKRFVFSEGQMKSYIDEQKKIEQVQKIDDPKEKNSGYTYNELAVRMLYEVEQRIGEKAFEEVLRVYYKNYSFQIPTGKEFIQLINETTGINTTHIYNNWIHKMELRECEDYESSYTSSW